MPKRIAIQDSVIQTIITTLEQNKEYTNRTALYNDVVAELVAKHGISGCSPTAIYVRVNKSNLVLKTPVGKKGGGLRPNPSKLTAGPKPRRCSDFGPLLAMVEKEKGGKYVKLVTSIKKGSLKAAIKLKCLDCANYQPDEVRNCECTDCPLHPIRPFQLHKIG